MDWSKKRTPLQAPDKKGVPEGLWVRCNNCREALFRKQVVENMNCCPKCQYHFRLTAKERIEMLLDDGVFEEYDADLTPADPLNFTDLKPYASRLKAAYASTGLREAFITSRGTMGGIPVVLGVMEYNFIGGSMGSVVGEKVTRAIEMSLTEKIPLILISCSGGARMMEGALSLMQMAKISAALARLHAEAIPYISVLTDPTTGGVTASFAMLGDLNIAEPKALIGFAGPRVIEQTIRKKLPDGFQRSEFLLEHGMLDALVPRPQMREYLIRSLRWFRPTESKV
ncbi:MAG: acetyl-CoA carboxylase carboxyltransferase subunit beta [Acidobacteria bacterium]|nr:acetyl-CoA carboxylase carboxyltransferase subunit beta [Acidobacteriota bacterium]